MSQRTEAMSDRFLKQHHVAYQVVAEVQEQNRELSMSEEELLAFVNEAVHEMREQTMDADHYTPDHYTPDHYTVD